MKRWEENNNEIKSECVLPKDMVFLFFFFIEIRIESFLNSEKTPYTHT